MWIICNHCYCRFPLHISQHGCRLYLKYVHRAELCLYVRVSSFFYINIWYNNGTLQRPSLPRENEATKCQHHCNAYQKPRAIATATTQQQQEQSIAGTTQQQQQQYNKYNNDNTRQNSPRQCLLEFNKVIHLCLVIPALKTLNYFTIKKNESIPAGFFRGWRFDSTERLTGLPAAKSIEATVTSPALTAEAVEC